MSLTSRSKRSNVSALGSDWSFHRKARNLCVMAMRPRLLPAEVELVRNLERSARAEVKLRLRYLRGSSHKYKNKGRPFASGPLIDLPAIFHMSSYSYKDHRSKSNVRCSWTCGSTWSGRRRCRCRFRSTYRSANLPEPKLEPPDQFGAHGVHVGMDALG
jgi:hypothetical protein